MSIRGSVSSVSTSSARRPGRALARWVPAGLTGGRDPNLLDTMAAAQAAAGDFGAAAETERHAIALASGSAADSLAAPMRERLKLYQRGVAYTESVAVGSGHTR